MARTRAGAAEAAGDPAAVVRDPTRGTTRDRRWQDFRRAVREARAAGAHAIRMHGAKVWLQQPQPQPQQPQSKSTVGASTQQDARQEAQPSARKRRSAARMHEFVLRKRYQQLATCRLRLSLLRAMRKLRWQRAQVVWTQWMRERSRAEAAVPMLLKPSEPSAPPSTPNKNKRTVEERSPDKTNTADGAAQPTSPNIAGGKQPRAITYSAAAGGGGGAHSPIDFESMKVAALKTELARRGLDTTGLKRDMLARLKAAHPLPALT